MKKIEFKVIKNIKLNDSVMEMTLLGDTSGIKPGQFVNIMLEGLYLRRPISVCDIRGDKLIIIYKVVGKGTEMMKNIQEGYLDLLTELGNGYDLSKSGANPLLIGGGVGIPPMYYLAKKLIEEGKKVTVILGFNTKAEIFMKRSLKT